MEASGRIGAVGLVAAFSLATGAAMAQQSGSRPPAEAVAAQPGKAAPAGKATPAAGKPAQAGKSAAAVKPAQAAKSANRVAAAPGVPEAPGTASGPAVAAGARTMSADELSRAGRRVEGTPSTTIYQARLADGTFELSDRPPGAGASDIARRSYTLPPAAPSSERAAAEREYWRGQAEAFERRRLEREQSVARERDARRAPTVVIAQVPQRAVYHGYGWLPDDFGGGPAGGAFVGGFGSPIYGSGPGVVQGRSTGGFIGSGFATSR